MCAFVDLLLIALILRKNARKKQNFCFKKSELAKKPRRRYNCCYEKGDDMNLLILLLTCIGIFAVGLCFLFFMPVVANLVIVLFQVFLTEQQIAALQHRPSDSIFIDPNELEELQ